MKRIILAALICLAAVTIGAQEANTQDVPKIKEVTLPQGAQAEDQEIQFGLSLTWPFAILNPTTGESSESHTYPGGMFSIDYSNYLFDGFFIGGSLGASFNSTITNRILFMVPLSFNAGFTFADTFIQIPLTLKTGLALRTLGDTGTLVHLDFYVKPTAGFYYRIAPAWSLGGEIGMMIMPDFYQDSSQNRVGFTLDAKIAVKYHL